ncbi:hypothetical protein [Riemerella anatipestifer]|uniref:Uncharacterized protein n=2 Tax=Riemerella anatipestifer TaxID=34085 RepID=A0AAP6HG68_RIEAN|nr:hypothetical protein [Riemerella anatipestifer]MBT0549899.1 hypothetical protein [Riemerella anatipestifer]MBT0556640.1 hypothetical protein [Riemerella anatipestifer]MBT0560659.1 hypothetical protein [Riemerella anatipestifer]MCO7355900.1 hypothetical protein [Riemerella anatipestifer]MCU7541336.1 hypothetical protein [Riemerella anatipestifer]
MNEIKKIAPLVWWRYAKAPQTLRLALGHLSLWGFHIPKINDYDQKRNCRNHQRQTSRTRPVH